MNVSDPDAEELLSPPPPVEVPAAAVGHGAPGGSDHQHRGHRSGPLAAPGPAAQRRPGGTEDISTAHSSAVSTIIFFFKHK